MYRSLGFASQVLVGLFGVSLRTLGMAPGCHGAVPLQQPTLNLISYCTGALCPPAAEAEHALRS
jgi:hypothetical protein